MKAFKKLAMATTILAALSNLVGCDDSFGDMGYGFDGGLDTLGYTGGYGPIDDDVFQNASDAWSDYIRG